MSRVRISHRSLCSHSSYELLFFLDFFVNCEIIRIFTNFDKRWCLMIQSKRLLVCCVIVYSHIFGTKRIETNSHRNPIFVFVLVMVWPTIWSISGSVTTTFDDAARKKLFVVIVISNQILWKDCITIWQRLAQRIQLQHRQRRLWWCNNNNNNISHNNNNHLHLQIHHRIIIIWLMLAFVWHHSFRNKFNFLIFFFSKKYIIFIFCF